MPTHRVRALLSAGAVTLLFAGCASSRLSSQPPPHVAIAGDWKLDWAASDRLSGTLARLAAQAKRAAQERRRQLERQQASGGEIPRQGPDEDRRMHRREQQPSSGPEAQSPESGTEDVGGLEPTSAPTQEFLASVPVGDYLRLTVSASAFTVIAGDSTSQYTPGVESVVESTSGEATQISGWKDGAYVIDTRPQLGPRLTQTFALTKDNKLAMTIRMQGHGADVSFTRLYDRTTKVAPLAPPTNN